MNTQLADAVGNLVTRVLRFVDKHFEGREPALDPAHEAELDRVLLEECGAIEDPGEALFDFRFRRACERFVGAATVANVFVDRTAPWALRKTDPERCASVLSTACQWIAWLAHWMAPFMPEKAQRMWAMAGGSGELCAQPWRGQPEPGRWRLLEPGAPLGDVEPLFTKLDDEQVQAEIAALEARAAAAG